MSPRRPCLDCGTPAEGNRCPRHKRARNALRHARQEEHGRNTLEWQALSRTRRALAGRCELQLDARCTGRAETAHLDPARNGEHRGATLEDVRAACRHCHGVADAPRAKRTQA